MNKLPLTPKWRNSCKEFRNHLGLWVMGLRNVNANYNIVRLIIKDKEIAYEKYFTWLIYDWPALFIYIYDSHLIYLNEILFNFLPYWHSFINN